MSLKTFVKVGSVTNLSDARYCAGMGVDILGFDISEDATGYIDRDTFNQIKEWVSGVEIACEVESAAMAEGYDFDLLELKSLPSNRIKDKVSLKVNIDKIGDYLTEDLKAFQYILVTGNRGEIKDDEKIRIRALAEKYPVLIGYGLKPGNIISLVSELGVKGIGLYGGDEIRPGYKDYDELADILEELEED